jgi:hypothetical protein
MMARDRIQVRANDELVLVAGTCEEVSGPHGEEQKSESCRSPWPGDPAG